jgi:REP element-mobilizing transposase RayT
MHLATLERCQATKQKIIMGRSRYTITEPDKPHFMTCTVVEWLPVFTRPDTVQIVLDCWRYQREHEALKLYGYVILENHLHFIAQAENLNKCVHGFKSFTARQLIDYLQAQHAERILTRLRFAKRAHKTDREFQFWQEGVHAELVFSEAMMREKLDYIHANPVKRGYVRLPENWRYSSASHYAGLESLIDIDSW